MTEDPISHQADLRAQGIPCALITVVGTTGSTPRKAGAKMLVTLSAGTQFGTIGGGKLEALAIEGARKLLSENISEPALRTYPLHEADQNSFGAICGGEVILLTEAFPAPQYLVIIGAGHCGTAIAKAARQVGIAVKVVDDRQDLLAGMARESIHTTASLEELEFFSKGSHVHPATPPLGFVAVSRNFETDLGALRSALPFLDSIAYIGMIGSQRKVRRVLETLAAEGAGEDVLSQIYAPIGLDIGAESPSEIAISVVAQILAVTRGKSGGHLRVSPASA